MIVVEPRASIHHEFTAHLKEISWIVNATLVVVHFKIDGNKISLSSLRGLPASEHRIGERTTRRSIDAHDENDEDDDNDSDDDRDDEGEPRTYIQRRSSYNCTICLLVCSIHETWPPRQSMCRTRAISTRIRDNPCAGRGQFQRGFRFRSRVAEARPCLTHMHQTLAAPVRLPNS